uniref:Uncharacterized protein n=1 Tax=Anguilla anguilla TaxID=7936 RepID=A0A0E9S3Y1_ANGAN
MKYGHVAHYVINSPPCMQDTSEGLAGKRKACLAHAFSFCVEEC